MSVFVNATSFWIKYKATESRISGSRDFHQLSSFVTNFEKRSLNFITRSLVSQLQKTDISSDSQNCSEMEKENQISVTIVA